MSKLLDAVNELTRTTLHFVRDADGRRVLVRSAPLLVQLRVEVAGSTGGSGAGASTTAAIPVAAAALDLLEEIRATVREEWWATHHLHHGHGRGAVATELRTWAAVVDGLDDDQAKRAERLVCGWVARITALLQPVRRWEIAGKCPVCGVARCEVSDDDGSPVHGPALVIEFEQGGATGYCRACKTEFDPQVLARLILNP